MAQAHRRKVGWREIQLEADRMAERQSGKNIDSVFGIPRGGCVVAALVADRMGVPVRDQPRVKSLVVDDIVDSGRTIREFKLEGLECDALFRSDRSPDDLVPWGVTKVAEWLVFPWEENETPAADAVVRLLQSIGEDPDREGLRDTPRRVVAALGEMTAGYGMDPGDYLSVTFTDEMDELVVVRDISFSSLCEHHMLPFTGRAHVGYIPKGKVVGLSKIPRTVQAFARRLQTQERLTREIADAIEEHLNPIGVGVVLEASHQCMSCRGAMQPGARMVTSRLLGAIRETARSEFLSLARG